MASELKNNLLELLTKTIDLKNLDMEEDKIFNFFKDEREKYLREKYKNNEIIIENSKDPFSIYSLIDTPVVKTLNRLIVALNNLFSNMSGVAEDISKIIQQDYINSKQWHIDNLTREIGDIVEEEDENGNKIKRGGLEDFKIVENYIVNEKNYQILYIFLLKDNINTNNIEKNALMDRIIDRLRYKALGIPFTKNDGKNNVIEVSKKYSFFMLKKDEKKEYEIMFSYKMGIKLYIYMKIELVRDGTSVPLNYDENVWNDVYKIWQDRYLYKDIDLIKIQDFSSILPKYRDTIKEIHIYMYKSESETDISYITNAMWKNFSNTTGKFTMPIKKENFLTIVRSNTLISVIDKN